MNLDQLSDQIGHDLGWNKDKTWPTGTNLLTAVQARAMLEYVLAACVGRR